MVANMTKLKLIAVYGQWNLWGRDLLELNTEFVGSGFMSSKNQTDGCMLVVGLIIFNINLGEYMKYNIIRPLP